MEVTLAPESSKNNSSLSSIASMLGVGGMSAGNEADALSVLLYPDIVSSTPFMIDLFDTPVKVMDEDAEELIALAKPLCCHINLIPVNPIKERDYVQSDVACIQHFKNKLEKNKINVTIRREMGRDIDGACGQLRRKFKGDKKRA